MSDTLILNKSEDRDLKLEEGKIQKKYTHQQIQSRIGGNREERGIDRSVYNQPIGRLRKATEVGDRRRRRSLVFIFMVVGDDYRERKRRSAGD